MFQENEKAKISDFEAITEANHYKIDEYAQLIGGYGNNIKSKS